MEQVPFCQRNVRMWWALLGLCSASVLIVAFTLAIQRGRFNGFAHRRGRPAGAPERFNAPVFRASDSVTQPSTARQPPTPPNIGVPVAQQVTPPAPAPSASMPTPAPTASLGVLDGITRATPNGGIRFIGGTQALDLQDSFNLAADIIRPAVVSITAYRSFAQFAPVPDPGRATPDPAPTKSVGSGVLIDARGYAVSNHHVVAGANEILVGMYGRSNALMSARVVASAPQLDLAVLQLLGQGPYPTAAFGNSNLVEVGDWALAVGSPFGLEHTVTSGIISGKRSTITINGVEYRRLLQADAPINQGSSGGPLVDLQGQVIGINTAIYAPTGVFNGTGFAIPSNEVSTFVSRFLAAEGAAVAGVPSAGPDASWLGIGVIDVTPDLARQLSYPRAGGVYVSSVILDSPADRGELTRGDIIVRFANQPVSDTNSLQAILGSLIPGQSAPMRLWRNGKEGSTTVTIVAGNRAGQ